MLQVKLYLYDSSKEFALNDELGGYRGEDLSKYVGQGFSNAEDITQELDISDIVLYGYPQQAEFTPETKFVIDVLEDDVIVSTLHRIVQKDLVNQPELADSEYFDHHITFAEPSVVAQKRLVDNISATYKLKDVTLEELVAYPQDENATMINQSSRYTPNDNFGYVRNVGFTTTTYSWRWGKYFEYEGNIELLDENDNVITKKYVDTALLTGQNGIKAKFRMPKLAIYGGLNNSKNFAKLGYASIDYLIEEFSLTDSNNPTNSWSGSFISNSNLGTNSNYYIPDSGEVGTQQFKSEWLLENRPYNKVGGNISVGKKQIKKYTQTNAQNPTYITPEITVVADRQYKITISLHEFTDNVPDTTYAEKYTGSSTLYVYNTHTNITGSGIYSNITNYSFSINQSNSQQTQMNTLYITYDISTKRLVLSSSTPYSALALLQKAVMNCTLYEKQDGVYIADINNESVPFYVDPDFIDELSETRIIENFYNQKNLWEILIEIGNYIHAIPEIVFGSGDRFMITFNKLGRTDQKENASTRLSIMNTRGVEDYVSACSSYITNMVQLGGTIEEWVSPKTTNETYLVSNDTAEILATKPFIELLEIRVRCDEEDGSGISLNAVADMTPFVYEENVYKTLSLDKNVNPNRGIAMYYSLGTNKIVGGDYQLPQASTNAYTDYAIKKIIYCAFFGYSASYGLTADWNKIKVNNYSFYIKYRTKDDVRQNHTRPDLRKYLLNSQYDKVPQHNQFNNQQDVVVDSIKFGNNMYGKLIKTGNTNYIENEWNTSYGNIKHKGELYRLNGDLYYVAKAKHTFYANHIVSEIEYSKDYNQLSQIIGIPSEPRFYEISEQSLIRREVSIDDYLLITTNFDNISTDNGFVNDFSHLKDLLFADGTSFSKFVITTFKGDKDVSQYDQTIGEPNFYIDVLSPINAYSSENTLTYEWDTVDNFSAGDKVVEVPANLDIGADNRAYKSLKAVQYTDIFGKVALFDFYILGNIGTLSKEQINSLPESPYTTRQDEPTKTYIGDVEVLASNVREEDTNYNGRGLGLLKDCREALSMNYNLQAITSSDTFVLSPFFYLPNKQNVRVVLLNTEVNKLSNGYIDASQIIAPLSETDQQLSQYFYPQFGAFARQDGFGREVLAAFSLAISELDIVNDKHFTDTEGYQRVKAIAVVCNVSLDTGNDSQNASVIPNKKQFIIARNIPSNWTKEQALEDWWFGTPTPNVFNKKQ